MHALVGEYLGAARERWRGGQSAVGPAVRPEPACKQAGISSPLPRGVSHPDQPDGEVIVAVTDRAAQRAKELGADEVLEILRLELEH